MCGINGIIQFKRTKDRTQMKNLVHIMNQKIVHRGPDHEGLYSDERCALGMRRLSIIDLQSGDQPIWNEDHSKLIVFNGEIYNFGELRKELLVKGHRFSSHSDTEVVMHGYEEEGIDYFEKLEGMFAFAIYDLYKRQLILARDRIGEKPLYYYRNDECLVFGSELKSLLSTGIVPKKIDQEALSTYFQLTYIPSPLSIIEGVKKLPQASYMIVEDDGAVQVKTYWHLTMEESESYSNYEWCKKQLRQRLFHSVEQRMISDVPLGAFLSGGFDSTIIVGIMSTLSAKPINTFTIGFQDKRHDESKLAELVARKNRTNHTVLMLDWEKAIENVNGILQNMDEPFADSSLIATYTVSKMARDYVKVVLTGDAGDELFAGYNKYLISYYGDRYRKIPVFLRKGMIEPLASKLPTSLAVTRKVNKVIGSAYLDVFEQRKQMMSLGFKAYEMQRVMQSDYVSSMKFIREQYDTLNAEEQTKAQYVDLITVLEGDMLAKVDRGSMLASLETRVPMLDRSVVELAFRMPASFKINQNKRKIILKDTFADIIPNELFRAPKHGFSVPIDQWLETAFRDGLLKFSDREFLEEQGLFEYGFINEMIDEHLNHRKNRYSELWAFYVFQDWYCRVMR